MTRFETQLIYHCAPTLLGIKQANLFSFSLDYLKEYQKEIKKYNQILNHQDIYIEYLYRCSKRIFLMVYRKNRLISYLKNNKISNYLKTEGYPDIHKASFSSFLSHLKKRTNNYQEFPHEIGFFLGYPSHDVFEYIHQKGKNFKFCGYWKVYTNEEAALRTFQNYKKCRELFMKKASAGVPIIKIIGAA